MQTTQTTNCNMFFYTSDWSGYNICFNIYLYTASLFLCRLLLYSFAHKKKLRGKPMNHTKTTHRQTHLCLQSQQGDRKAEKGLSLQSLCICPGDSGGEGPGSGWVFELPTVWISCRRKLAIFMLQQAASAAQHPLSRHTQSPTTKVTKLRRNVGRGRQSTHLQWFYVLCLALCFFYGGDFSSCLLMPVFLCVCFIGHRCPWDFCSNIWRCLAHHAIRVIFNVNIHM